MYFSSPRVPSFKSILGDAFKLRQPDAFFKNFMNLYFFKAENPIVKKKKRFLFESGNVYEPSPHFLH